MAQQVQLRRGTAAEHTTFTGASGEVTVDTTDKRLVVHDGSTAGGVPVAKESELGTVNITGLTAETALAVDDLVVISDTSAGSNKKMTVENVLKVTNVLTADAAPDVDADYIPSYDASASGPKKVLMSSMLGALRGHIYGLTLSNNVSDATNDIDIAAGEATDGTGVDLMILGSSITKRLDAAWAVGTNQGGLDTGAIANDVYHIWLIKRPDTGVVDVLFSASATAPTMPTNYTLKRRIGAIIRSGGTILPFTQIGDDFLLTTGVADHSSISVTTTGALYALTVPDGIKVEAKIFVVTSRAAVTGAYIVVSDPDVADAAPTGSWVNVGITGEGTGSWGLYLEMRKWTNTSAQIRARALSGTNTVNITTYGWKDPRGKF